MTYLSNNTIVASDFNEMAGRTDIAAPDYNTAFGKAGYIFGVGYGDIGYGQVSSTLQPLNVGETINGTPWKWLRDIIYYSAIWQGLTTTLLPASTIFNSNSNVSAHNTNTSLTTYEIFSRGNNASTWSGGVYYNGSLIYSAYRSYNMIRISRTTGNIVFNATYDIYGNASEAARLATDLNGSVEDVIVVVYCYDEPQGNRFTNGLDTAMYRCGASTNVFGSANFQFRAAYVLVGIPGCGMGNGFEAYSGDYSSDSNAGLHIILNIQNSQFWAINNKVRADNYSGTNLVKFDGVASDVTPFNRSGYDLKEMLNIITANRFRYLMTYMSLVTNVATSTRATTWGSGAGGITCEFSCLFPSEDQARYFFNTGGEIRLSLNHPSTLTTRDASWNTTLNNLNIAFTATDARRISGPQTTARSQPIGYYDLTTSYQQIFNGTDSGQGTYISNDVYIDAKSTSITGANGAKGNNIYFRVTLTDTQTNVWNDLVQPGTVCSLSYLVCAGRSGVMSGKTPPSCSVITDF